MAVAQVATTAMTSLSNKMNSNTAKASDFSSAATALQSMFANFDEAGYTAMIANFVIKNEVLFTTNPTTAQINAAYNSAKTAGSTLTLSQFTNFLTYSTLADREGLYTDIENGYIETVHSKYVGALQTLAARYQNGKNGDTTLLPIPSGFHSHYVGLLSTSRLWAWS